MNDIDQKLHYAIRMDNIGKMEILLGEFQANPNAVNDDGKPFLWVANDSGTYRAMKCLLNHGADPNIKFKENASDKTSSSLLLISAKWNHLSRLELLLKFGANIHYVDNKGNTALSIAAGHGDLDNVKALIEHGADINQGCLLHRFIEGLSFHNTHEVLDYLLINKINVNQQDWRGNTAIMSMLYTKQDLQVVEKLFKHGADVTIKNNADMTAMDIAKKRRYKRVGMMLEQHYLSCLVNQDHNHDNYDDLLSI